MTYIPKRIDNFEKTAASSYRVSQMTTLFDGKLLGGENTNLFSTAGTGTATYSNNIITLSVTANQYIVRQSSIVCPYFSGKSQLIEATFDGFQTQTNCTKQVGYFSSSETAPYNTILDGFFIENANGVFSLKAFRNGTQTINVPFTTMDNYDAISSYNWQNFTVVAFDFLWLGGAGLRFFVKVNDSFELIHTVNYAGSQQGVFILNPHQPIRYVLRSSGGVGSFNVICSQVATEGSINFIGRPNVFYNESPVSTNTVTNIYPLIAIRKSNSFRFVSAQIVEMSCINSATTDTGLLMLIKNGTQTGAAMNFNLIGQLEVAFNSNGNQRIAQDTGDVICIATVSGFGNITDAMSNNFLSFLSAGVSNVNDIYYLCYRPISNNQSNTGTITIKTY
jgi:hypothetical protein